jgi:hypothetical protein
MASRCGRGAVLIAAARRLPAGRAVGADLWSGKDQPMATRYAAHLGQGTLRDLGPGYWYGGPWLGVTLLHVVKEDRPGQPGANSSHVRTRGES